MYSNAFSFFHSEGFIFQTKIKVFLVQACQQYYKLHKNYTK